MVDVMAAKMKKPVLTLKAFIRWASKMPSGRRYNYFDNHNCIMCQFVRSQGFRGSEASGVSIHINGERFPLGDLEDVATGTATFGAATERARKILRGESIY